LNTVTQVENVRWVASVICQHAVGASDCSCDIAKHQLGVEVALYHRVCAKAFASIRN
jgi:hypothetical protein